MNPAFIADLETCASTGHHVEITTITDRYLARVIDLDADEGWVRITNPQAFGDDTTTTTLNVSDLVSVSPRTEIG